MRESLPPLLAVLFVVAAILAGAVGLVAAGSAGGSIGQPGAPAPVAAQPTDQSANASTNTSIAPGARLSGVLGSQQADLEGEVEARTFGIAVAKARTNRSKATVVEARLASLTDRLDALRDRKQALTQARQNGSIDQSAYAAQMTEVVARIQTIKRLANQSSLVARGLPGDVLAAAGVNVSAIGTLRERANQLTGPEVAALARSIAGPGIGGGFTPPGLVGKNRTIAVPGLSGNVSVPGPPRDVPGGNPSVNVSNPQSPATGSETGPPVNATNPTSPNETRQGSSANGSVSDEDPGARP